MKPTISATDPDPNRSRLSMFRCLYPHLPVLFHPATRRPGSRAGSTQTKTLTTSLEFCCRAISSSSTRRVRDRAAWCRYTDSDLAYLSAFRCRPLSASSEKRLSDLAACCRCSQAGSDAALTQTQTQTLPTSQRSFAALLFFSV